MTRAEQYIKGPKTESGIRAIAMPEEIFVLLREWKKEQTVLCVKLGKAWKGHRKSHRRISQRIGSELPGGESRPYPLRAIGSSSSILFQETSLTMISSAVREVFIYSQGRQEESRKATTKGGVYFENI